MHKEGKRGKGGSPAHAGLQVDGLLGMQ